MTDDLYTEILNYNKMNRQELQEAYISAVIEGMDMDDCLSMLYEYMDKEFNSYTDEELLTEVSEYYPELVEDTDTV